MSSFTAIDFETAQGKRWSICQIGLVRVENGKIEHQISQLIQPPGNIYFRMNTAIHGISSGDTFNAPTFASIWPDLRPYIEGQTVVAHNAAFDFSCLKQTLEYYRLSTPDYNRQCTYRIFGRALKDCCRQYGVTLDRHHDALSDALACAKLYQIHLTSNRYQDAY